MEPWGQRPKKFQTSVAVPAAPVRVPSQRPLAPSVASFTSDANDKDDNEMILWLCTDLLAFVLQLRKTSARRQSDEGTVCTVFTVCSHIFILF